MEIHKKSAEIHESNWNVLNRLKFIEKQLKFIKNLLKFIVEFIVQSQHRRPFNLYSTNKRFVEARSNVSRRDPQWSAFITSWLTISSLRISSIRAYLSFNQPPHPHHRGGRGRRPPHPRPQGGGGTITIGGGVLPCNIYAAKWLSGVNFDECMQRNGPPAVLWQMYAAK